MSYISRVGGLVKNRESPDFKSLEVGISEKNLQNFRLDQEVNPGHLYNDHTQCLRFDSQ